jgi:hypothetical protein
MPDERSLLAGRHLTTLCGGFFSVFVDERDIQDGSPVARDLRPDVSSLLLFEKRDESWQQGTRIART